MIPLGILASARVAAGSASLYHVTSVASASATATTWTFTNVPLGDAEDRTVLVCMGKSVINGGGNTVTVAGSATTQDVVSAPLSAAGIYRLSLPAATTTGSIVVTSSTSEVAAYIHVYAVNSAVAVTDTDGQNAVTGLSRTLTTAAGGFALAVTGIRSNSAGASHAWTGVTEDADLNLVSGTSSAAHADTTGADLTAAVTLSGGSSLRNGGFAVATYALA